MNKIKVFAVDDHPIVLEGLTHLLSQSGQIEITGTATHYMTALREIENNPPDIAIVDIGLSGKSGIDLISELQHVLPQLDTVVFSMYDELTYAPKALRAGAKGYIMKSEPISRLVAALLDIRQGKTVVSENVKNLIFNHFVILGKDAESLAGDSKLTMQEENIFRLIGEGQSTSQIAKELFISPKTVQTHKDNIRHKLRVRNSSELYRRAILFTENGVITPHTDY